MRNSDRGNASPNNSLRPLSVSLTMLLLSTSLFACEEQNAYVAPPPPKVTVARPLLEEVTDYLVFTGTTAPAERVEVRARVPGVLQSVKFEPGSIVEAGEILFVIDPLEYEAAVQIAQAQLAQAKAIKVEADKTLERAQTLIKRGNIAQAKVDEAEANSLSAEANVQAAEASLVKANLNLSYTTVEAPISGRVGRNLVDAGNLVGESEPTILTHITAYDPIYVYFNINELDLLEVIERRRGEREQEEDKGEGLPVELSLANETDYSHKGITDFAESAVDPGTGTLQLRGRFDNPGDLPKLLPGLFARVRVPIGTRPDLPLVSERAIGADQSGRYVLVVNSDNVVEKRNIQQGRLIDGLRVIEEGLEKDDRVVVNGIQRARPGGEVDPTETEMASLRNSARQQAEAQDVESPPAEAQGPEAGDQGKPVPDSGTDGSSQ